MTRPAFVQASYFTAVPTTHPRNPNLVVIHATDGSELAGTAMAIAEWFAGSFVFQGAQQPAPAKSAHWVVDALESIQCVFEADVAWAAPGANRRGVHVELCGRADQTSDQWHDTESSKILRRGAATVAGVCERIKAPLILRNADEVRDGADGICGHDTVSLAFPKPDAHTDPGPNFPWGEFMEMVRAA